MEKGEGESRKRMDRGIGCQESRKKKEEVGKEDGEDVDHVNFADLHVSSLASLSLVLYFPHPFHILYSSLSEMLDVHLLSFCLPPSISFLPSLLRLETLKTE